MSNTSIKNNNFINSLYFSIRENLFPIIVYLVAVLILGVATIHVGVNTINLSDKIDGTNETIVVQYKTLQQESINNYNLLLTNSQNHPNQLININELDESYKVNDIEKHYNSPKTWQSGYDCGWSAQCSVKKEPYKKYVSKINNLLKTTNNKLIENLKKVNYAISKRTKINYDSLKITNNNFVNSRLQPIINEYEEDYSSEVKQAKSHVFHPFIFVMFFITFILGLTIFRDMP